MDKQRSKRKKELQDGFDMLFRNQPPRNMSDAMLYGYVLYEQLGYELKFNFYENEFQIYDDDIKIGSCLNLYEMQYDEVLWDAISILDEPEFDPCACVGTTK